jgi:hypothetical protein
LSKRALRLFYRTTAETDVTLKTEDDTVAVGQFSHVAAVIDTVGGVMQIYLNGQTVAARATAGPLVANNLPLTIGLSDKHGFYGLIDEPSVYNRALSQAEIQSIVKAGSAGKRVPVAGEGKRLKTPQRPGILDRRRAKFVSPDNLVVSGGSLQQAGVRAGFFLLRAPKRRHTRDKFEKNQTFSWRDFAPDLALKTTTTAAAR